MLFSTSSLPSLMGQQCCLQGKCGSVHPPPGRANAACAQSSSCAPPGQSALQHNCILGGKKRGKGLNFVIFFLQQNFFLLLLALIPREVK